MIVIGNRLEHFFSNLDDFSIYSTLVFRIISRTSGIYIKLTLTGLKINTTTLQNRSMDFTIRLRRTKLGIQILNLK